MKDSILRDAVRAASRLSMVSRSGLCIHTPEVSLHSREHSNSLHPGDIYPGYLDHRRLSPGVLTITSTVVPDVETNNSRLSPGAYTMGSTILPGTVNNKENINPSVTLPGEANTLGIHTPSAYGALAISNGRDDDPSSTKNVPLHSATQLDVVSLKSIDSSPEVASKHDKHPTNMTKASDLDSQLVNKQYIEQGGGTSRHDEASSVPLEMTCGLTERSTAPDEAAHPSEVPSQDDGSPNEKAEVASHTEEPHSGKRTNSSRYTTISSVDTASTMTTVTD